MVDRVSVLEAKVAALWPEPKKWDLFFFEDSNTTTGIVNTTNGTSSLMYDRTPYPSGCGGAQVATPAAATANYLTRPGGLYPMTVATTVVVPYTLTTTGDTTAAVYANNYASELCRPLQALAENFGTSSINDMSREADKVRVYRIQMQVKWRPDWSLTGANAGWNPGIADKLPYLAAPARLMLLWIEYPNALIMNQMWKETTTSAFYTTPKYGKPFVWALFKNWAKNVLGRLEYQRQSSFPATMAASVPTITPDSAAGGVSQALTEEQFDDYIWDSALNETHTDVGQDVDLPPFRVHRVKKIEVMSASKEFITAPAANAGYSFTAGTSATQHLATQNMRKQLLDEVDDFSLDFGPSGKVITYLRAPRSEDGTQLLHSPFGLCEKDLRLVAVTNRTYSFWNLKLQGNITWFG